MCENNVKFKRGNSEERGKRVVTTIWLQPQTQIGDIDRRFSKNRDLFKDFAMLESRRFFDWRSRK